MQNPDRPTNPREHKSLTNDPMVQLLTMRLSKHLNKTNSTQYGKPE